MHCYLLLRILLQLQDLLEYCVPDSVLQKFLLLTPSIFSYIIHCILNYLINLHTVMATTNNNTLFH